MYIYMYVHIYHIGRKKAEFRIALFVELQE